MELYGIYFAALALFNAALAHHRHQAAKKDVSKETLSLPAGDGKVLATKFQWEYFSLYGMVMVADWLQVSTRSCL